MNAVAPPLRCSAAELPVSINEDGSRHLDFLAPGMSCAGCMSRVERTLGAVDGIRAARVNLSAKRISVDWNGEVLSDDDICSAVAATGFEARPIDLSEPVLDTGDETGRRLLWCLGATGFAAANIMLLSVSVWSGAEDATRDLFHWISALIAIPAVFYGGRPFFDSALSALKARQLNMDVPISLAVLLALGMSIAETARHSEHAYFDAAVTLLFFLLIGRYLDHAMRARTRSAVARLMGLSSAQATVVAQDGTTSVVPVSAVRPGDMVLVAAGERLPVDGTVAQGRSDIDRSMVTGESMPETAVPGDAVHAGTENLTSPLRIRTTATGRDTFLADVVRLMEGAESSRTRAVRWADRAARVYAPAVHLAAALTFAGWFVATGDWRVSLLTAIAVLIITCPCALGLAVPAVQVVASGVLFRRGVLVKDGSALERMSEIDMVVFDKTGTLTAGEPALARDDRPTDDGLSLAAGLARESRHPLSRAIVRACRDAGLEPMDASNVTETAGKGLEGFVDGKRVKLGSAEWCGLEPADTGMEVCLVTDGRPPERIRFEDALRDDAATTLQALRDAGYRLEMLSGDRVSEVERVAGRLGIDAFTGNAAPADKLARLADIQAAGGRPLMVGDGINDGPALAAAHVSMAPSSASDVGRTAADFVFLGRSLYPVRAAVDVACRARRLVWQNFAFAAAYNAIAVPLAASGQVTPLIAALAMSGSSIVVTANALRLRLSGRHQMAVADGRLGAPAQEAPA